MTTLQQSIILFLNTRPHASMKEIKQVTSRDTTTCYRALTELSEEDFIESEKGQFGKKLYFLTVDGKSLARRLARYEATDGQIVQPARINKLEGLYVESPSYQRNDGCKSIGRVGVPC